MTHQLDPEILTTVMQLLTKRKVLLALPRGCACLSTKPCSRNASRCSNLVPTNALERFNQELKRRTRVARNFTPPAASFSSTALSATSFTKIRTASCPVANGAVCASSRGSKYENQFPSPPRQLPESVSHSAWSWRQRLSSVERWK